MTTGVLSTDEGVATSAGGASSLRVAVLDRDSGFIQVLGKRMDRLGWEHRVLASPVPADGIASMRLSALVVDLAVLGPQAWEWLERLCGALPELGIVVCTGPSTVAQRVRGLRLGADDWITKPCHPEEVIARVQGLVRRRRRATARTESKPVSAGEVEIRSDRFQAFVAGRSLELTRREFELIELLAGGEGRVLEREEIYSRLWGYAMVRGDRSVDVFVRKLRQKLEKASPDWRYIHTHFGIGYRFAAERGDGATQDAPRGAHASEDTHSGSGKAGELDPGDRDTRDQGKLSGAQHEYELSAGAA
jgi:DNA-binding response OmpR family regulator